MISKYKQAEYELTLVDRLDVIRKTNKAYNLEQNAYVSFSGGKDSTVLHYVIDEALPGNRIPRVFINTGIEFNKIVEFVKQMANQDDRIILVAPSKKVKDTLEAVGYPFKSKVHSKKVEQYQCRNNITESLRQYIESEPGRRYGCPEILKYQFTEENHLKISHRCCNKLKKEPAAKWCKQADRKICITGITREEGGARAQPHVGCVIKDKTGAVKKFNPMLPITNEWEAWFIQERQIQLCDLYYPPYNFTRTGCKGCPFALELQEELDTMAMYLPAERKQCEIIWKPVYDEYRRLGYRLNKPDGQITLWEEAI